MRIIGNGGTTRLYFGEGHFDTKKENIDLQPGNMITLPTVSHLLRPEH